MEKDCHVEPVQKTPSSEEMESSEMIFLSVQIMGCRNCANRVQNSLIQIEGVIDAEVSHTAEIAEIYYNPELTNQAALVEAVARAGRNGRHEYQAQILI